MSEPSNTKYAFKWINGNHSPFATFAGSPCQYTFIGWEPYVPNPILCQRGYHFCYPNISRGTVEAHPYMRNMNTWLCAVCEWQSFDFGAALWVVEVDVDTVHGDQWYKGVTSTLRFVGRASTAQSYSSIRSAVNRALKKYGKENFIG